jgi:hypothetical protein
LQKELVCGKTANVRKMMRELDCGCGCHLEGKDKQCLCISMLLHLEAAHPEIEEPTMELAEEMVVIKGHAKGVRRTRIRSTRSSRLFS